MRKEVLNHFKSKDPVLSSYIERVGDIEELEKAHPRTYFYRLCREIIFQQLSDKAGNAILKRFEALFPEHSVTPAILIDTPHEKIRGVGLSNAKARYVKNIAEAVLNRSVNFAGLSELSEEEIVQELTHIKGVGRWTAEMFMMFVLGREDVFSFGDLGLKKGLKKVYGLKKDPSVTFISRTISRWSPFKTYGCLVLWKSLELK